VFEYRVKIEGHKRVHKNHLHPQIKRECSKDDIFREHRSNKLNRQETFYCQLGTPTTILGLEPRASALGGLRATIAPNGHEEKTCGVWYITINFGQPVRLDSLERLHPLSNCLSIKPKNTRLGGGEAVARV
jgi:hypothetical protein